MSSSNTSTPGNSSDDKRNTNEHTPQESPGITRAGHWIPDDAGARREGNSAPGSGLRWTGDVVWVVPSVPGLDRPPPLRVKVDSGNIRRRLARIEVLRSRDDYWADYWLEVLEAVAEIPALLDAVEQLQSALKGERRRYADLLAAGKATLSAHRDGENDPLTYLRDEIHHGTGSAASASPDSPDSPDSPGSSGSPASGGGAGDGGRR